MYQEGMIVEDKSQTVIEVPLASRQDWKEGYRDRDLVTEGMLRNIYIFGEVSLKIAADC